MANERAMRDTLNAVDRGSQTAQRMAAAGQVSPDRFNIPSLTDMPTKAANWILNRAVRGSGEKTVAGLDKALAAQGAERDAIIRAAMARTRTAQERDAVLRYFLGPFAMSPVMPRAGLIGSEPR